MPRIRSIKPEIHQDEAIGELSDSSFRLFVGLITLADDYGRLKGGLTLLASQVWPHRPRSPEEVDALLEELVEAGLIHRYSVDTRPFVCLPSWAEHQRISNAGKSSIPPLDRADSADSPQLAATRGGSPLEGRGEEGRGEESAASAASSGDPVLLRLQRVTDNRSLPDPDPGVLSKLRRDFPGVDLLTEADDFAHYWTDGDGGTNRLSDVMGAFRRQLVRRAKPTEQKTDAALGFDPDPYEAQVTEIQV